MEPSTIASAVVGVMLLALVPPRRRIKITKADADYAESAAGLKSKRRIRRWVRDHIVDDCPDCQKGVCDD